MSGGLTNKWSLSANGSATFSWINAWSGSIGGCDISPNGISGSGWAIAATGLTING
jgi:hypothetical protein